MSWALWLWFIAKIGNVFCKCNRKWVFLTLFNACSEVDMWGGIHKKYVGKRKVSA